MRRHGYSFANVVAVLMAAAVIAMTLNESVRDIGAVVPLAVPGDDAPTLIPLPVSTSSGGTITRSTTLRVPQALPPGLFEIELRADTYGGTPALAGGALTFGGGCTFEAAPGALQAGGSIILRRTAPCAPGTDAPETATLVLHFDESDVQSARCALLGVPAATATLLQIQFDSADYAPVGRYTALASERTMTRAALLAYMWERPAAFVWRAFAAAVLLVVAGGHLLAGSRSGSSAAGVALVAAGLALAYAVLVPPLQAPDEPNHLLGYANATGDEGLPARTVAWAKALHFERITFQPGERFRPSHTTRPHEAAWGSHVTAVDEISRSMLNVHYWRWLAPWLDGSPATTLLRVRAINAIVFGAIVGMAALLVSWKARHGEMHFMVMALLLVPTLPFFAMHMSNYALLVDAFVLFAAGVAAVCHGRTDSPAAGFLLGCGLSLALAASFGSLAMIAVLGASLAAAVLGRSEPNAGPRYLFWAMFVAGALVVSVAPAGADPLAKAGVYRGPAFTLLSLWRWIAIGLGLAGVTMDYLLAALARQPRAGTGIVSARALQLLAAGVTLAALASLVWDYPVLQPMETRDRWPTPPEYAGEVLRTALGLGRISHPDWFLSSTFWAGFGWLDAYPGDWLTNLLTGATVAALLALLLVTARARDSRKAVRLLLVACGAVAALAIYAAGASVQRTNLHGRYVFGLYLCGVAVCWSVLAVAPPPGPQRRQAVSTVLLAAIASLQAVCLVVVLRRYF